MRKEEEENTIAKLGSKIKLGFSKWFKQPEKKKAIVFEESKLEYDEDGIPTNMHLFYNPDVEDIKLDDDIINSGNQASNLIEEELLYEATMKKQQKVTYSEYI